MELQNPNSTRVEPGLNLGHQTRVERFLSHAAINDYVRVDNNIQEKMAFGVPVLRLIVLLSIIWLRRRRAARRRSQLFIEMSWRARTLRRRTHRARRHLFLCELLSRRISSASLQQRTVWVRPRSRSFWLEIAGSWSDTEWKRNFRVNRATFVFLCRELQPHLQRSNAVRTPLSLEHRVAICLWRLGTNVEYRTISHLFGVGISTVCVAVHDVCNAIVENLAAEYIRIPTGQGLRRIVSGFLSKWNFPQCVGAIDGSHIPIIAPSENPLDYYNRKGYHSIVLQALVDHEYRFLDVYVGWPGSVHDARVLGNSTLYTNLESGILPNWSRTIYNTSVPLLILGDPAYPLKTWLMKPFSDTGLTARQRKFNYQLSRARVVVENGFGRLKGRWRSLMKRNDSNIKFVPTIVTACCILHNLCEQHGDACEDDWIVRESSTDNAAHVPNAVPSTTQTTSAARIREALCDYFF